MIESKFKLRALLIPVLIIAFAFLSTTIINNNWPIHFDELRWIDIYMTVLFAFTITWLIFGELRTKIIMLKITNTKLEKRIFLGLNRIYDFRDFDGFHTSILTSKGESYEYLYLVKGNQKIIKISEAYHKNYDELKNRIAANSKDLGEIKFSYFDELKEILK
jgi:hypothetical protein